jgi:hypothetical protein
VASLINLFHATIGASKIEYLIFIISPLGAFFKIDTIKTIRRRGYKFCYPKE